jgi:hypothetical protein
MKLLICALLFRQTNAEDSNENTEYWKFVGIVIMPE